MQNTVIFHTDMVLSDHMKTIIGCHISSAGGMWKVFDRAKVAEVDAIQTFAGSPQTWKPPEYSDDDVAKFMAEKEKTGFSGPMFIHAMYLIGLASENNAIRHGSINALTKALLIAEKFGFTGVITHSGSAGTRSFDEVLPVIKKTLTEILAGLPKNLKTKLFLENAAGQGAVIGSTMHELGEMLRSTFHDPRLAICIDTCHAFVSGYDIRTDEGIKKLSDEIEHEFGWERVGALHINDSKGDLGSHLDRHEIVGKGFLGLETFKKLLSYSKFSNLPWILETPDLKTELNEVPESLIKLMALVQ